MIGLEKFNFKENRLQNAIMESCNPKNLNSDSILKSFNPANPNPDKKKII